MVLLAVTDVLKCCNIPSLAKIPSRPGGGTQSHLSLNILCHSNPNVTHCAEDRWWKPQKVTHKTPKTSQNYAAALIVATFISSQWSTSQKLLATTSCTTALPPVSNTTCRKVITLRQCLKGHADMLTHEHDLCISFLWVSLVSFSRCVLL